MTSGFGFSLVVVKVYPTLVPLFCLFLWYRATEVFLSKPSNSHFIDATLKRINGFFVTNGRLMMRLHGAAGGDVPQGTDIPWSCLISAL
jgi:hypothetical protein